MLALAVITLRLVQYGAAAVLMGSSLFLLVVLPKAGGSCAERLSWPRNLLAVAAAVLALASGVGLIAQTAGLAGSISEALSPSVLGSVITTMNMGPSSLTRAGVGVLALILLLPRKPTELGWWATALLGAVGCASFAWMGHGAATEGMGHGLHLAADIIHGFAASMWIGALAGFLCLLGQPTDPGHDHVLHLALEGFAGLGSALVAIILGTGLINSWFLVGPDHWRTVLMVPYGQLLALKVLLFLGMLLAAAANRFWLTPALGKSFISEPDRAVAMARLRTSLLIETGLAVCVLALVAWFGTLAPVSAQ